MARGHAHVLPVIALRTRSAPAGRRNHGHVGFSGRGLGLGHEFIRGVAAFVAAGGIESDGQTVERLAQVGGIDVARAGSLETHGLRHGSDDGDPRPLGQRQDPALVLQQHSTLLGRPARQGMVLPVVADRLLPQALYVPEDLLQNAPAAGVDTVCGQPARAYRRRHLIFHIGAAARHAEVAAGSETFDAVAHAAPVGDNETVKAPLLTQDLRQQATVVAAVDSVQFGIGAHHRGGPAFLDSDLKARQIDLAQRPFIENGVGVEAAEFL